MVQMNIVQNTLKNLNWHVKVTRLTKEANYIKVSNSWKQCSIRVQ